MAAKQATTLIRLAAAFAVGIVVADVLDAHGIVVEWGSTALLLLALFAVALLTNLLLRRHPKSPLHLLFALCALTMMALVGMLRYDAVRSRVVVPWADEEREYEALVVSEPVMRKRSQRYELSLGHRRIYAYLPQDATYSSGDSLRFRARIRPPENFTDSLDFDYARFLYHRGISGTVPFVRGDKVERLETSGGAVPLRVRLARWRASLISHYVEAGFSDDELGVLSALSLGDKSYLSDSIREVYSIAGASHVLALSGLHVGIIYLVLGFLLTSWGNIRFRRAMNWAIILSLWLFALLSGASPSILRAVTMCTIYGIVRMIGHSHSPIDALSLTALVLLFVHPFSLFDVGFELSFCSMLSILFLMEHTEHRRSDFSHPVRRYLLGIVQMSVAAQLGTFPLVLHYFHAFPTYFLVSNLIIIPLIYIVMIVIVVWWAFSWTFLSGVLTTLLAAVLKATNALMHLVSTLPLAQLSVPCFGWMAVVEAYLASALVLVIWASVKHYRFLYKLE